MKFEQGEIVIFIQTNEEVEIMEVGPFTARKFSLAMLVEYGIAGCKDNADYLIGRDGGPTDREVMFCNESDLKRLEDGNQPADAEWAEKFMDKHITVEV